MQAIRDSARRLGFSELEILQLIAERLEFGQRKYGVFVLDAPGREWIKEFREEQLDGAVYSACAQLTASDPASRAQARELLAISLRGVYGSLQKPKLNWTDRIYFAILGREGVILMATFLFIAILAISGWYLARG